MSETHFFLGFDPAPSAKQNNDDAAMAVLRAIDRRSPEFAADRAPVVSDFQCDFVFGRIIRNLSPRRCSGIVYGLHERYGFANIVMDGQGGGIGIMQEMKEFTQLVGGVEREVVPIVTREEDGFPHAQFILSLMRRSDPAIKKLWGDKFQGDDQMLAAMHGEFCEAVNQTAFGLPPALKDLSPDQRAVIPFQSELEYATKVLEWGKDQLLRIAVLTGQDGTVITTKNGARKFAFNGRKDIAYSMIYAWIAFVSWLRMYDEAEPIRGVDEAQISGF